MKKFLGKNLVLKIVVMCFMTYICYTLVVTHIEIIHREKELEALIAACEEQRIANKELERMVSLAEDDAYIERIARDELDYAYPDERIFIDSAAIR